MGLTVGTTIQKHTRTLIPTKELVFDPIPDNVHWHSAANLATLTDWQDKITNQANLHWHVIEYTTRSSYAADGFVCSATKKSKQNGFRRCLHMHY